MRGLITLYLNRFLPFKSSDTHADILYKVCKFSNIHVVATFIFTVILYILSAAYPAWPLFERNPQYWSMHLIIYPIIQALLNTGQVDGNVHLLKVVSFMTMLLLIHPFVLMCVEAYLCSQLNDAEKLNVATCAAAYTDNYIDVNSQLACANLINVDMTSIAHGSCAYLINHVASAVQAFEFIALILLAYKDALIFFAMQRCITHVESHPQYGRGQNNGQTYNLHNVHHAK